MSYLLKLDIIACEYVLHLGKSVLISAYVEGPETLFPNDENIYVTIV